MFETRSSARPVAVLALLIAVFVLGRTPAAAQQVELYMTPISPGQSHSLMGHTGFGWCNSSGNQGGVNSHCDTDAQGANSRIQVNAQATGAAVQAYADGQLYWDFKVNGQGPDVVHAEAAVTVHWNGYLLSTFGLEASQAAVSMRLLLIDVERQRAVDAVVFNDKSQDQRIPTGIGDLVPQVSFVSEMPVNVVVKGLLRRETRYRLLVQVIATASTATAGSQAAMFSGEGKGLTVMRADVQLGDDAAAVAAASGERAATETIATRSLIEGQVLPALASVSNALAGLDQFGQLTTTLGQQVVPRLDSIAHQQTAAFGSLHGLLGGQVLPRLDSASAATVAGFAGVSGNLAALAGRIAGIEAALGRVEAARPLHIDVARQGGRKFVVSASLGGQPTAVRFTGVVTIAPRDRRHPEPYAVDLLGNGAATISEVGKGLYLITIAPGQPLNGLQVQASNAGDGPATSHAMAWSPGSAAAMPAPPVK